MACLRRLISGEKYQSCLAAKTLAWLSFHPGIHSPHGIPMRAGSQLFSRQLLRKDWVVFCGRI